MTTLTAQGSSIRSSQFHSQYFNRRKPAWHARWAPTITITPLDPTGGAEAAPSKEPPRCRVEMVTTSLHSAPGSQPAERASAGGRQQAPRRRPSPSGPHSPGTVPTPRPGALRSRTEASRPGCSVTRPEQGQAEGLPAAGEPSGVAALGRLTLPVEARGPATVLAGG